MTGLSRFVSKILVYEREFVRVQVFGTGEASSEIEREFASASGSEIDLDFTGEVGEGTGVAVCPRKANASARVDVPATPDLSVHAVLWDTMLSEVSYDGTDMCASHSGKELNVYQSVFDGKVSAGDTIRLNGRLRGGAL